ncbi:hypothetical protein [Nonomuraea sp. KM90]|uniref:hypothetical protein n=1 Tax=Nonomuraea sp. KM90 TaxID=3457428 RepID=UPI003FCE314E
MTAAYEEKLVPGLLRTSWREGALTRIRELEVLSAWAHGQGEDPKRHEGIIRATEEHIRRAREAVAYDRNSYRSFTGALFEAANSNCDAAEANLLRMAPNYFLLGQLPSLTAHVTRHLPEGDPRLQGLDELRTDLAIKGEGACTEQARTQLVALVRAASSEAGRELMSVRRFRNVLLVATFVLSLIAVAVAVAGMLFKDVLPLCFTPQRGAGVWLVCPTGEMSLASTPLRQAVAATTQPFDLLVVELLGLVAAAVTAGAGIQGMRARTGAIGLPVALALFKLPFGALTAFIGLLLMRGQFVPGLSALDTSAQIIAWAVLLGGSQQVFTRLVDQQAKIVVGRVRGARQVRQNAISASPA